MYKQERESHQTKRISKSLVLLLFTLYLASRGGLKEACVHGVKESLSPDGSVVVLTYELGGPVRFPGRAHVDLQCGACRR